MVSAPGGRQVVSAPGGRQVGFAPGGCQVDVAPGGPGGLSARWRQVGLAPGGKIASKTKRKIIIHIFSHVCFLTYGVKSRSGHGRSQSLGQISHVSGPKLTC